MRFDNRLDKLELISGGCSECGGPPGPGTPLEIRVSRAYPGKPPQEPEQDFCPHCLRRLNYHIQVRGEATAFS